MTSSTEVEKGISALIEQNDVVLFMKGTKHFPQCGFSSRAISILNHLEVGFESVDVLQDMEIRQGIKEYSDWPTIPQLYVKGEFVGGSDIMMEMFEAGQKVDVTGTSIGKGFAGGVKRHNFQMQDATHGNSLSHRAPGSIGQNQTPGRVFKGKKMAGHMGAVKRTTQNLRVVRIDEDRAVILIRGAVPGADGSDVIIKPAVKQKNAKS